MIGKSWDLKKLDYKKLALYVLLLAVSGVIVILYSGSTSPLYPYNYCSDSAQFQTIGMAWANGKIPYRDMFDHKGPMAFFFDMLSFKFWGSNIGLCYFQTIFMFIDLLMAYKICQLYKKSTTLGIITVVFTIIFYMVIYGEGNKGEEYCLPFLFISTYYQIKYLRGERSDHSKWLGLLYGASFGICLFSKLTNGVAICVGTLVIAIELMKNKKWINLLHNAIAFIVGILIIAIPFSVYFATYGCFKLMLFCMLSFNFDYIEIMGSWLKGATGENWYQFSIYYFPYYCAFFTSIVCLKKRNWTMLLYNVLILVLEGYIYGRCELGWQYVIVLLPNIPILLSEIFDLEDSLTENRILQIILIIVICSNCIETVPDIIKYPANSYPQFQEQRNELWDTLMTGVPEDERDSFIAFNVSKDIYLLYDIVPYYKYFAIQSWHACFNKDIYKDIQDTFYNGDVTWLLTGPETGLIQQTLDERYFLVGEREGYALYHINFDLMTF